ncbi:MAG: (d)CMP kinase [Candidatus Hydrothermarchaeales archaeon]
MIVTVGGPIGSGKTTIAKAFAEKFNLKHISAGKVFREMAEERGMSLAEFSKFAEEHHELDREVDKRQIDLAKDGNAVIDGRLSGWMMDADLKIWLYAPLKIRAARVANREGKSYQEALIETEEREKSEKKRYRDIYDIDMDNISIYDITLNTSKWDEGGTINVISSAFSNYV